MPNSGNAVPAQDLPVNMDLQALPQESDAWPSMVSSHLVICQAGMNRYAVTAHIADIHLGRVKPLTDNQL